MANTILVGAQWGDEGKGKIIDFLTENMDVVVRTQGGNNAGHTIYLGSEKYVLHLIPSGILRKGKTCVIGNGVVVDPIGLVSEIEGLRNRSVNVGKNFLLSDTAHLVLPYHKVLDKLREAKKGRKKIGTTQRGIGPAYGDKIARVGLRVGDLLKEDLLRAKLRERVRENNALFREAGLDALKPAAVESDLLAAAEVLRPFITNTTVWLHGAMKKNKKILFEGAQGTFLDIDHGTYPYVTSSNTTAGGACTGSGIAPNRIDRVMGVLKAYTTRVGEGSFPTESSELSDRLHEMGREFGATTGRARRCGWLDLVMVGYANMINGFDELAITNLDGLDELSQIRVCVGYRLDGKLLKVLPSCGADLERCEPVYKTLPGWGEPTHSAKSWKQLPANARNYVEKLSEWTETPVKIVSVGPARDQTILL